MYDNLIILFSDIFNKRVDEGSDGYLIVKFSVPLSILCGLYERLSKIDVPTIETLPVDEKERFWNIGKQYYETESEAIKGSKAAYMLSLITNSN